jgi:hypothetical protein
METKSICRLIIMLWILLSAPGCATWEEKLDQRAKWKKFHEESNQSPTLPFRQWPREK